MFSSINLAAGSITIWGWLVSLPPAFFLCSDMAIHPYGWWVIGWVSAGAVVALMLPELTRRYFQRIERFRELAPLFERVRARIIDFEGNPERLGPDYRGEVTSECGVRLHDLGVAFPWPPHHSGRKEYEALLMLMEQGRLREARRRWPVQNTRFLVRCYRALCFWR